MNYYKIISEDHKHGGLIYKEGLNELPEGEKFNPSGDCEPGGMYFSREDILCFLDYGPWIYEVEIPPDSQVYENPGSPKKWKSDKIILKNKREINLQTLKELVAEGVDIHARLDEAFRWACTYGHLETAKWLFGLDDGIGVNIHAHEDYAFRYACASGRLEIAKWLYSIDDGVGVDIHVYDDQAFRYACGYGHIETAKWLYSIDDGVGVDIHVYDDQAFRYACKNGHIETAKWLYSLDGNVNIHAWGDEAFRYARINGHLETVDWLKTVGKFDE